MALNPIKREGLTAEEVQAQPLPSRPPGAPQVGGREDRKRHLAERLRLREEAGARTSLRPETEVLPGVPSEIAADRALTDVIALDVRDEFDERHAQHMDNGNVETQAAKMVREMAMQQDIDTTDIDFSSKEDLMVLSLRMDWEAATSRQLHLIYVLQIGAGASTAEGFESGRQALALTDARRIKDNLNERRLADFNEEMREFMKAFSFKAPKGDTPISIDQFLSIVGQDGLPGMNQLTRSAVLDPIMDMLDTDIGGFLALSPTDRQQRARTALVAMSFPERLSMASRILSSLTHAANDPVYGFMITRMNVIEQAMEILTPDVMTGVSAADYDGDTLQKIFQIVDLVMSIWVLGSGFKSLGRIAAGRGTPQAFYLAAGSGKEYPLGKIFEVLQNDDIAKTFGLAPDELVPPMLPKPATFVNKIDDVPEGVTEQFLRTERQREEIIEITDKLTGRAMTEADRAARVKREFNELAIADNHMVMSKMSTLEALPHNTGYRMTNIIGQTGRGAWESIDEMLKDVAQWLDNDNLEAFQIMRININGKLEPVFESPQDMLKAIFEGIPPEKGEFYLSYTQERFYHPVDKLALDPQHMNNAVPSTGRGWTIPPNVVFGEKFYGDFLDATLFEQNLNRKFNEMLKPYFDLGVGDKRFVNSAFEWGESYAKDHGRGPTLIEYMSHYENMTPKQLVGLTAIRQSMDTMYDVLNRRLYREFNARGAQTARSTNSEMPNYHGIVQSRESVRGNRFYDPTSEQGVNLTRTEIDELYRDGGKIMEVELPVYSAGASTEKYTLLVIRDEYEIGKLSTNPLIYTPEYTFRFHKDPYYIIKIQDGVTINGQVQKGRSAMHEEAVRTAGTKVAAERWVARIKPKPGVTWQVVRARDIAVTESTLFNKQVLQQEGRMFWDNRSDKILPDVNGNTARLEDPVQSLERGIGLASRQLTHEDLLSAYKGAFESTYADVVGGMSGTQSLFKRFSLREIVAKLTAEAANTVNSVRKRRVLDAKEVVEYFRLIEGTESLMIPKMREMSLSLATAVTRALDGIVPFNVNGSSALEKYLQQMDPFRTMRSVAFKAFMVIRPVRQAIMQSAQIGYLAPLAPAYVGTGQIFRDAIGLRLGLAQRLISGYDSGIPVRKMAKWMGMSVREYRHLIKMFDRSGIVDIVDAHSFAGGSTKLNRIKLPETQVGMIGYRGKQLGVGLMDFMQRIGFNFGEKNNLTFTWGLALNRLMHSKGYKSVLDLSDVEWETITRTASNLGLGMIRANNLKYQSGALSVGTQFLSFSHKAALGMMALNPNINGKQALTILGGTLILYGGNQFGAREWVEQQLLNLGVSDQPMPGTNVSLVDLLSAGVIDSTYNALMDFTDQERKALDLGFLAPGIDLERLYQSQIMMIASQPLKAAFGPFGSGVSKVNNGLAFADWVMRGAPDMAVSDQFILTADAVLTGALPQYTNAVQAYLGHSLNRMFTSTNEAKPLRPTMEALIAKFAVGVQTKEEVAYFGLQRAVWDNQEEVNGIIRENRKHFTRLLNRWRGGAMTAEDIKLQVQLISNLWYDFPEARRMEILQRSLMEDFDNGQPSVAKQLSNWMAEGSIGPEHIAMIDQLVELAPEARDALKAILRDTYNRRLKQDEQALKLLQENK